MSLLSNKQAAVAMLVVYLLFVLLPVGGKLTGQLTAGWWWILLTLWGPWAFAVVSVLVLWLLGNARRG